MDRQDTYFIKLQGKANIPEPLEVDKNYRISADCSITQEKRDSNNDGSFAVTFKAEPVTVEILKENGKIVKAADPRKNSVKFRNSIWKEYYNEGYTEDFDSIYDQVTLEAIFIIPELMRRAIKKINEK